MDSNFLTELVFNPIIIEFYTQSLHSCIEFEQIEGC